MRQVGGEEFAFMNDIWQKDEVDWEEDLLAMAREAGIQGVASLIVADQTPTLQPISIVSNRYDVAIDKTLIVNDRTFARLVFKDGGPSIRHFKSGLQLLQALRSAIESTFLCFSVPRFNEY